MSSLLAERPASPLIGDQRPRILSLPSSAVSWASGEDTAELARNAGLILDDWQRYGLVNSMAETAESLWAAFEVAFVLSRQNGKNGIVEARQLGGLFLLHHPLMIHTAEDGSDRMRGR